MLKSEKNVHHLIFILPQKLQKLLFNNFINKILISLVNILPADIPAVNSTIPDNFTRRTAPRQPKLSCKETKIYGNMLTELQLKAASF